VSILSGAIVMGCVALGQCSSPYDRASVTVDMTVSVHVDGKPTTFSAVQRFDIIRTRGPLPSINGTISKTTGQAPYITWPDGSGLFVLMGNHRGPADYTNDIIGDCGIIGSDVSPDEEIVRAGQFRQTCTLSTDEYPSIVYASNVQDFKTYKEVNSTAPFRGGERIISIDSIVLANSKRLASVSMCESIAWICGPRIERIVDMKVPFHSVYPAVLDIHAFVRKEPL
jgi:hypothetical protein